MAGNLAYSWSLFQRSWNLSLPTFGLGRFFGFLCGHDVTFGFWIRIRTDRVKEAHGTSLGRRSGIESIYLPLMDPEIRLFVLRPGCTTEPLQGYLITGALGQVPQYEALSYAWGDPMRTEPILVNGASVAVTVNLESALRYLRHRDLPRVLWIDTICINQHDLGEKRYQVSIMQSIYTYAEQVVVWLGLETEHSSTGMEILAHLANGPSPDRKPPWETRPPMLLQAGLADIMGRAYWERMWVVQELAVSRRAALVCGHRTVSWPADFTVVRRFLRYIKLAEISPQWERCGLSATNMGHLTGLLEVQQKQLSKEAYVVPDMLDLAHNLRHRKVSDLRDKLFAIRGLTEDVVAGDFMPDYGMSVEETYARFNEIMRI